MASKGDIMILRNTSGTCMVFTFPKCRVILPVGTREVPDDKLPLEFVEKVLLGKVKGVEGLSEHLSITLETL
jgi:hypothetical protein